MQQKQQEIQENIWSSILNPKYLSKKMYICEYIFQKLKRKNNDNNDNNDYANLFSIFSSVNSENNIQFGKGSMSEISNSVSSFAFSKFETISSMLPLKFSNTNFTWSKKTPIVVAKKK
jgi:hypothetical protein